MNFRVFVDVLLRPKEVFAVESTNTSFLRGVVNHAFGGFLVSVLVSLIWLSGIGGSEAEFSVLLLVAIFVALIAYFVLFGVIAVGVAFVVSRLLGGSGGFIEMFYLSSLYYPALAVVGVIPVINILAAVYSIYLFYLVVRHSQGLSRGRAAFVVLWPILLIFVVLVVVLALVFGRTIG